MVRNKIVWDKEVIEPLSMVVQARAFPGAFRKAQVLVMRDSHSPSLQTVWVHPPNGVIKLNFDGAVLGVRQGIGTGVIARNENGHYVGWLSKFFSAIHDPKRAEALAAHEAMELSIRMGWREIILEEDCLQVISKLRSPNTNSSFISSLVSDIKCLVSNFICVSFSHVKRAGNRVAHSLARLATSSHEGSVDHP
ncbi:hypothetical protein BUALT_Bualt02G0093200 [Buddleja alternifolia]|uniref:RNase H type-1 domain-containing protein n=1 Tax=Buddleja alternifolia TaxID=168488 RepID=A0AAV6Y9W4_9LAMI|nr:hypothetical protein BUALT_Bualt02G0093200 [Buddleja alternifolia]